MNFWKRLFGKKSHYPLHGDGLSHGQWSRGDLAVCVVPGNWEEMNGEPFRHRCPAVGDVWRVTGSYFFNDFHFLTFAECSAGFTAAAFRKAVIDEHKACESEFVDLLKRAKRKIEA